MSDAPHTSHPDAADHGYPVAAELRDHVNRIPIYGTLGMEAVHMEPGRARLKLPFRHGLTQPMGVMHGGAIAALADSAVAVALMPLVPADTNFTTIELKVNYLRPISEGTLWAEADIIHSGRRTALGEVTLTNDAGKLVAKALATYMLIRPDH